VEQTVKRLQRRIAEAAKQGKYRKMRSLQWLLAHSRLAKLLAIRQVTSNKGKNTPGVDGVVWRTSRQKMRAVALLNRRGYRAKPLRRVYIPKKSGKLRPLGIPTVRDRAMQALYALTLQPIAETTADPNSYGFRIGRSCADAVTQCFYFLCLRSSAEWVLECDIKSCFDEISHRWIQDNVPVDRRVLSQWLRAGYIDKGTLYPTMRGTPQGGIISPLLMNMTLDGLERAAKKSVPYVLTGTHRRNGVSVIRYADDFVVTCKSREWLQERVKPAIESFLRQRGLVLSEEKTRIVNVQQGFDFLGQNVRKRPNGKLLTQPSHDALKRAKHELRRVIEAHRGENAWSLIGHLNQMIRGWCNYHRHACASRAFKVLDTWLFHAVRRWLHHRHRNKGRRWLMNHYYCRYKGRAWTFTASRRDRGGKMESRYLLRASSTKIVRHVKVRGDANPFDSAHTEYFLNRRRQRRSGSQDGRFVQEYGWLSEESCS
jgi:RNA-directed DNA polymerase